MQPTFVTLLLQLLPSHALLALGVSAAASKSMWPFVMGIASVGLVLRLITCASVGAGRSFPRARGAVAICFALNNQFPEYRRSTPDCAAIRNPTAANEMLEEKELRKILPRDSATNGNMRTSAKRLYEAV